VKGIKNKVEWSFDEEARNGVSFVCCSVVVFNFIYLHWHWAGGHKERKFPKKFRLRSLEIGRWRVPLRCYEI